MAKTKTKASQVVSDKEGEKVANSLLSDGLGIGGGLDPSFGYPWNQGVPGTAQVENTGTIFKNLRYYFISNMRQVLSQAYVELGLVQTICRIPVFDGMRGGVTIRTQELDEEQIAKVQNVMKAKKDLRTVAQGAVWNRLYGGAGIMVITDQDPEMPLDVAALGPGTALDFRAADMWELFFDLQNLPDYAGGIAPNFKDEGFEFFDYYGEKVHETRVMLLKGLEAPSFLRPRLRGWGFSVVEALVRSLNQYLKSTDLAFEVLDEFKVDIYKIKNLVQTLMMPDGANKVRQRVQTANLQKNFQNAVTMDSEDDWDHKQVSFAGLADMMMQIRMQVASDMRMPLTKLFGISASGFNSGEDDIEVYNAMVESEVREIIEPYILKIVALRCQNLFGIVPSDLSITFQPMRVMSSEQEENVKMNKFNRAFQAVQAGRITQEQFIDICNKSELFDVRLDPDTAFESPLPSGDEMQKEIGEKGNKPPKAKGNDAPEAKDPKEPKTANSLGFDKASYLADGGDARVDPRREEFFKHPKDLGLYARCLEETKEIYNGENWKFTTWLYLKMGGSFH